MKFILSTAALLLSLSIMAEENYKHCTNFIDNHNNRSIDAVSLRFNFRIDPETGKFVSLTRVALPKPINGVITQRKIDTNFYGINDHFSVTLRESPEREVKVLYETKNEEGRIISQNEEVITFKMRNGICYPEVHQRKISVNDKEMKFTNFKTGLCRKIHQELEKNDAIKKCLDPNSEENKRMSEIFEEEGFNSKQLTASHYGVTYDAEVPYPSVEQKIVASMPIHREISERPNPLRSLVGGSSIMSARLILSKCYDMGLAGVIEDKELWKDPEPNASSTELFPTPVDPAAKR